MDEKVLIFVKKMLLCEKVMIVTLSQRSESVSQSILTVRKNDAVSDLKVSQTISKKVVNNYCFCHTFHFLLSTNQNTPWHQTLPSCAVIGWKIYRSSTIVLVNKSAMECHELTWWSQFLTKDHSHHLGISYYFNLLGHLTSNGFQLKRRFGTHGNWKNQNPGGRFGATS